MDDQTATVAPDSGDGDNSNKRKRRRRRKRRSDKASAAPSNHASDSTSSDADGEGSRPRGRRTAIDIDTQVNVPASGRNPHKKRGSRAKRSTPKNATARRRQLSRGELSDITEWLQKLPESLLSNMYRGLGGQPNRVANPERMIQLTVRAIAQGSRLGNLLKQLHERDRKALAALMHAGGIGHADEFHRELSLSYGGHEREWKKVMTVLANRGLVMASAQQDGEFMYIVPEVLIEGLVNELTAEMQLPIFRHDDVQVLDAKPFTPPLDFSIATLATYVDQNAPRLTQRHEIYRHDQEEMDAFFAQIWDSDSELFGFHIDFLLMHGMIELRGEYLSLNRDVMEEWLQLEAEDQRDLLFRALNKRFDMAEWVLWAIHEAQCTDRKKGEPLADDIWVAERPLVTMYRRWKRGEDWRNRFERGEFAAGRTSERESYSFAPLVRAGILEMGRWGQEKFYRLSPRGRMMLEPDADDGFKQFYLTPNFEIMAPAGLAPILLFRIGELADLTGCDRANTFRITEQSIERGLKRGWRRDDVLQFLRDNSQIGLPDNVEQTLKGWIGHRGDVEFHDLMLLTVHRSQIRRFESHKRVKPLLLHRFAPGMYAVDRTRHAEILDVLEDCGFHPAEDVRGYPGDPEQVDARHALHRMVAEAREDAQAPAVRGVSLTDPDRLLPVPGTKVSKSKAATPNLPPEIEQDELRILLERAMSRDNDVEMVYQAKTGQRLHLTVQPHRMAFKADSPVLVALDRNENERRTFLLERIERAQMLEAE